MRLAQNGILAEHVPPICVLCLDVPPVAARARHAHYSVQAIELEVRRHSSCKYVAFHSISFSFICFFIIHRL